MERRIADEERRKIYFLHQEDIHEMQSDIKDNEKNITHLEVFQGRAEVVGVIALVIFGASFLYTYNHKQHAERQLDQVSRISSRNTEKISEIRGDYKALVVEVKNLIEEVDESNVQLSKIVEYMTRGSENENR